MRLAPSAHGWLPYLFFDMLVHTWGGPHQRPQWYNSQILDVSLQNWGKWISFLLILLSVRFFVIATEKVQNSSMLAIQYKEFGFPELKVPLKDVAHCLGRHHLVFCVTLWEVELRELVQMLIFLLVIIFVLLSTLSLTQEFYVIC